MKSNYRPETLGVQSVLENEENSGDVAQAIHLSTTFHHGPAYEPTYGYTYARDSNPNVASLEKGLVALERGKAAIAFASGVAAGAAALQLLPAGSKILFHQDTYLDFKNLIANYFERWGLEAVFINMADINAVKTGMDINPAMVWFETPSNPQLDIVDIEAVCSLAHEVNALVLVDSTFATPVLQQPLTLGADIVLQATTKYIGGHSDTMGGALILKDKSLEIELRRIRKLTGGVMAPFSAWLAARGLQTLCCRVEKQCENAMKVANYLEQHSHIEKVHYPGLVSNAGHTIASRQMHMYGALVSFQVIGGASAAIKVASKVTLFTTATSIGGVESLLEHRPSVEGDATQTPAGLLRASIGLEHVDDIIADLDHVLSH